MKHCLLSGIQRLALLWLVFNSGLVNAEVTCIAGGQCTQTIVLNPGWNAIYLKVTPDDGDDLTNDDFETATVFADFLDLSGPQISSVWTWLPHRARIEFVQNQSTEDLLSQPGWLRFFPTLSSDAFLTNLHAVSANRAYLVKLEGGDGANLVITGKPVLPRTQWVPDTLNFIGFHVDPASPPTFTDFFAASSAHTNPVVYQLDSASGVWELKDPMTTNIDPDLAYWIYSDGGSSYTGPVQLDRGKTLNYGSIIGSLNVGMRNLSTSIYPLSMSMIANGAPMNYDNPDPDPSAEHWLPLPLTDSIGGDEFKTIPLGIRRATISSSEYNEVLEIKTTGMNRWLIPVSALAPSLNGLWVGVVSIAQVSQANNYRHDCTESAPEDHDNDPTTPDITYGVAPYTGTLLCDNANGEPICDGSGKNPSIATGAPIETCADVEGFPIAMDPYSQNAVDSAFDFRIILHEDSAGQVTIVNDVIQMWRNGTDPVTDPGHYVLITDDSLLSGYVGIGLRDGEVVGKRVSTIAYDIDGGRQLMSGAMGDVLDVNLTLAAEAPTNPFRHRYHPDHNSLDYDYETPLAESYSVSRNMTLSFGANQGLTIDDGYTQRYGTYQEVVVGLHKNPIFSSGTFVLRHISPVDTLDDE